MAARPLVVVVGETASGKSSLAMQLAKKFNGELINADSWSVYRGFDIGTAKPSTQDRAQVRHHLIDIADANTGFNAAKFQKLAKQAIKNIQAQNKLPILVGGTGLYIDSVIFDYGFLANPSRVQRARLDAMDLESLLDEAKHKNIDLSNVDTRNKRRVVRAIENNGQVPTKKELRSNTLIIGLAVNPEQLSKNIHKRVNTMVSNGLEQEVRQLASKHGWDVEPMKGIGYKEWQGFFEGTDTLEDVKRKIASNTTQLAKRQRTWFKRNKNIHWTSSTEQAFDLVQKLLNKKQ